MITASTVKVSTMADDTLRLVIDIEPMHAQEAFALFGQRGSPVVIARLTNEAATQAQQEGEKPKGGPLARLAGQWCADPQFQYWIGADSADQAAELVREKCGIRSRAELDHDGEAASQFDWLIRLPFMAHMKQAGIEL